MFKGRLKLWVSILVICLIITYFSQIVSIVYDVGKTILSYCETKELSVYSQLNNDRNLSELLSFKKINGYKLSTNDSESADIMFISDDDYVCSEDYTKHEDFLKSPIVLFTRDLSDGSSYKSGFITVTDYAYNVNLLTILEAMENGLNWEDLNVYHKVASGPVVLYIPNEATDYYDAVVELFYLTLNNGVEPTEIQRRTLKPRVDKLLEQCVKVTDMCQTLEYDYYNSSKYKKVYVGPEFLLKRVRNEVANWYMPVYFLDTVSLTIDIYTRNDSDIATAFLDKIQNKESFFNITGWRVLNHQYKLQLNYLTNP